MPFAALPDPAVQEPLELGAPLPEAAPSVAGTPPGAARLVIPHFSSFNSLINYASRTYRYTHDEAIRHSAKNALAIRRDPVVMDALRSRQLPTAQLAWHLEADNETDPVQAEAVEEVTKILETLPRWQTLLMHCLEALWYGRYGVQVIYGWDFTTGKRRLVVRDHKPVNGDKLVFRWSGEVGVLVHSTHAGGDGNAILTDRGHAHLLSPEDREHFVIHRHEPEDADYTEADMAGAIHGVGIRSRIYWLWWMRTQVTAWLMDYLERVGAGGFTIYYYEAGSPDSLDEVKQAAEEQWRNNSILFPRYKTDSKAGPGIERVEASNSGASLLQSLITEYFDNLIRRFILGLDPNVGEEAHLNIGGGGADLKASSISRVIKYDAVGLQETLTTDLVRVIVKHTCPKCPPSTIRLVFDVDKPNVGEVLEAARAFYEMGGQIDEDSLRSVLGLPKPQKGHSILAKVPPMSPTAVGGVPGGVPMVGQPGPAGAPNNPAPMQQGPAPTDQAPPPDDSAPPNVLS